MSDFNINIKQTRSGDATKETLQDLRMIKSEAPAATRAAGEGFEGMGRKIHATRQISEGFMRTMKGDMAGIAEVANGLRGVWSALGAGVAVMGAGIAGWKIGLQAQAYLWDKIVGSVKDLGGPLATTREEFEKIAKVKLDALRQQVEDITQSLGDALSLISKAEARAEKRRGAAMEEEIALVPEGPGKDLAIAGIRKKYGQEAIEADRSAATSKLSAIGEKRAEMVNKIADMRIEIEDAEKNLESVRSYAKGKPPSESIGLMAKQAMNRVSALHKTYDPFIKSTQRQFDQYGQDVQDIRTDQEILPARENTIAAEYKAAQRAKEQQDEDYRRGIAKEMADRTHAVDREHLREERDSLAARAKEIPGEVSDLRVKAQEAKATGKSSLARQFDAASQSLLSELQQIVNRQKTTAEQVKNMNR